MFWDTSQGLPFLKGLESTGNAGLVISVYLGDEVHGCLLHLLLDPNSFVLNRISKAKANPSLTMLSVNAIPEMMDGSW